MILTLSLGFILDLIMSLILLIPVAEACNFTGVTEAISWFGYVYGASSLFIPYSDVFAMFGIIMTMMLAQITIQAYKSIRGSM